MFRDNLSLEQEWIAGCGAIKHTDQTIKRVKTLLQTLKIDSKIFYELLISADKIANSAMWLAVSQVYAKNVYLDGRELAKKDFKEDPQGHLGASLNMVPAYVGYMLANALTGITRAWVMEQGHAVSGIDSVNLLLGNLSPAHAEKYSLTDSGLTAFSRDFYSYKINEQGKQESPLGSHVNPHTAGGFMEGGYLGFASVQYVHMPLPGERLVAFLSDGAFEEQRGADWAPRWWRAEDSGLVAPIMIANGRRIDQRTTVDQEGGADWFAKYLELHGFEPIIFDGRDPSAFAWTIIEQEKKLQENTRKIDDVTHYNVKMPYGIAVAPKGAGFYNEGTNYAHNLPLVKNPSKDAAAAEIFNSHAQKLFVALDELKISIDHFNNHRKTGRGIEQDNPLAHRNISLKTQPQLHWMDVSKERSDISKCKSESAMDAIDMGFLTMAKANSHLRPRVGNPDEMLSNKMDDTLEAFSFRVVDAEGGAKESTLGDVITALNEEAVAAAAFGNKGGINIIVTYEAFGSKMFGEARQEVIFAKHQKEIGTPAKWLSVPIILTSNTWENSKNELSHQDPSMSESMLSETSDISRVVFPADYNTALATLKMVYNTQGQVWTVVVAKQALPIIFSENEAEKLIADGGCRIGWAEYKPEEAEIALVAMGSYQLVEILKASEKLRKKKIPHTVSYIIEPGRFREARNENEKEHLVSKDIFKNIIPSGVKNVIVLAHTRPELIVGIIYPLFKNKKFKVLGFINEGGTLNVSGMLFVNKCSWAHILKNTAEMLKLPENKLMSEDEIESVSGRKSPCGVLF